MNRALIHRSVPYRCRLEDAWYRKPFEAAQKRQQKAGVMFYGAMLIVGPNIGKSHCSYEKIYFTFTEKCRIL